MTKGKVTIAPFVNYSVNNFFYSAKVPAKFFVAAELRRRLSDIHVIFNKWRMFWQYKIWK